MAKFAVTYTERAGSYDYALDDEIEADVYRAEGKFFNFYSDHEIVRSVALDLVAQIRRVAG